MMGDDTVSSADTLPAGSRIGQLVAGKYRIERLLGRGGMGEVYEARHAVVGRRFAVKFLHPHLAGGSSSASRFLREAQTAGSLDSPHIAAVLDFDTAPDGSPFLVMEYLAGESLAKLLEREGPLPVQRAASFVLQACEGLAVAHRAGIVHRDLKPDNLLVVRQPDGSELLKILDFGIAKLVDTDSSAPVTQSGAVLGTPFYMAPEQARGEKSLDFRVDLYALGVIFYELVSGRKPHPGDGYNAILAHILTQPIAPLAELCPTLPPALLDVIERALAREPARRPASAAALARELAPYAGRELGLVDAQHFDLRPAPGPSAEVATHATHGAENASTSGTLESAVGDVQRFAAEPRAPRRASWVLAVAGAALLALGALLAKSRSQGTTSPLEEPARRARSAAPAPLESAALPTPAAPSPTAPGSSAPLPAPASAGRPAPLGAKKLGPAPSSSSRRRGSDGEIKFDEKNPY